MINIDRRAALGMIGFGLMGVACKEKEILPTSSFFTEPISKSELDRWNDISIPYKISSGQYVKINNVDQGHIPQIGLQELYVVPEGTRPLIGVIGIWKSSEVKFSSSRNAWVAGFQPIGESFTPSINDSNANTSLDPSDIPFANNLGEKMILLANNAENNRKLLSRELFFNIRIIKRPLDGSYAFIWSTADITQFQGKPHLYTESIVGAKFRFEPGTKAA